MKMIQLVKEGKRTNTNIRIPRSEYKKVMSYLGTFHERLLANNPELDAVATDPKYWRMVEAEFSEELQRTKASTWVRALMTALWKQYPNTWKEELVKKLEEYGFKVTLRKPRKKRIIEEDVKRERQRYTNVLRKALRSIQERIEEIEEEKQALLQRLEEIEEELTKLEGSND